MEITLRARKGRKYGRRRRRGGGESRNSRKNSKFISRRLTIIGSLPAPKSLVRGINQIRLRAKQYENERKQIVLSVSRTMDIVGAAALLRQMVENNPSRYGRKVYLFVLRDVSG